MPELNANSPAIVARATAMLLAPRREWPRIAVEPVPARDVFLYWVAPLAAIGPISRFLHGQIFGWSAFGIHFHPGLPGAVAQLVAGYLFTLIGVFVLALIADALAPLFSGVADRAAAVRLVSYAATASFLAGVFWLIPGLGILGLLGLYSVYLFHTGAAPLMRVPQDKAAAYTAVTLLAALALALAAGALAFPVLRLIEGSAMGRGAEWPGGGLIANPYRPVAGHRAVHAISAAGPLARGRLSSGDPRTIVSKS